MRVVGFGGRNYKFEFADYLLLETLHRDFRFTEAACGMCNHAEYLRTRTARGADMNFYVWCMAKNIPVTPFAPDLQTFKTFGQAAYARNLAMAIWTGPKGGAVCFPGGTGTSTMLRLSKQQGVQILYNGLFDVKAATW